MMRALLPLILSWLLLWPATAAEPPQPRLRLALETTTTIPGQPIVMRLTLLVPTWLPKPPEFPSFEVPNVMVRLPARASGPISERIDGETWSGISRAYRVYPMMPGHFRIPSLPVTVTYAAPETRKPVTVVVRTEEVVFEAEAPAAAKDLDPFIAAVALTLEQAVEGDPEALAPGGAFTRSVTAQVKGTSPLFLPPLIEPLGAAGIASYPQEPLVEESEEGGILSGRRVERTTYVAEGGGHHVAPPIRLSWYNLRSGEVEVAEVPGFEILSRGPLPATTQAFDWRADMSWAFGAAFVVLAAVAALLRLRPRLVAWYRQRREARRASEAFAFAQAARALRAQDFPAALRALALWSARLRPVGSVQDSALAAALESLGAALYGKSAPPPAGQWSEALRALQAARRVRRAAGVAAAASALPPLNPRRAA